MRLLVSMKYSVAVVVLGLAMAATPRTALAYGINMSESGNPLRWMSTRSRPLDPELETRAARGTASAPSAWPSRPGAVCRECRTLLQPGVPAKPGHHGGERAPTAYTSSATGKRSNQLAITVVTYNRNTGEVFDADILVNANASYDLIDESGPVDA